MAGVSTIAVLQYLCLSAGEVAKVLYEGPLYGPNLSASEITQALHEGLELSQDEIENALKSIPELSHNAADMSILPASSAS